MHGADQPRVGRSHRCRRSLQAVPRWTVAALKARLGAEGGQGVAAQIMHGEAQGGASRSGVHDVLFPALGVDKIRGKASGVRRLCHEARCAPVLCHGCARDYDQLWRVHVAQHLTNGSG